MVHASGGGVYGLGYETKNGFNVGYEGLGDGNFGITGDASIDAYVARAKGEFESGGFKGTAQADFLSAEAGGSIRGGVGPNGASLEAKANAGVYLAQAEVTAEYGGFQGHGERYGGRRSQGQRQR